jgi:hypothetical protein|tara:strand:- start:268 stop:789 length:522 start_codon:yes stop_codon:yes gene_type:complete
MADITINSSDTDKIDVDVSDSNNLNLKLTGGDKGLRLHVLETIYPVGSIYTNAGVATNPGTLLGFGTWSAFGSGRVIVGVDSTDTDFDAVRETGGSKTDSHSLSIAELPAHTHQLGSNDSGTGTGGASNVEFTRSFGEGNGDAVTSSSVGSGSAHTHDIVQPYITAYMWRRTA